MEGWSSWLNFGGGEEPSSASPATPADARAAPKARAGRPPNEAAGGSSGSRLVARGEFADAMKRAPRPDRDDPFMEAPERVLVRVYDLGTSVLTHPHNKLSRSYGAFHTGVEVFGREWSFGMTNEWVTGVTWCPPGQNPDHTFRETLAMGHTHYSFTDFTHILDEMKQEWRGCDYNLLTRNCHHFSDAFCRRLGVMNLPAWINDLAGVGDATVSAFDKASTDIPEMFYDLYARITGTSEAPTCLKGRERPERALPPPVDDDGRDPRDRPETAFPPPPPPERARPPLLDDSDDEFVLSSIRRQPPARGEMVYPAGGDATVNYQNMS